MAPTKEQPAKPDRLSQFLQSGGKWLFLAALALLLAIILPNREDWPQVVALGSLGLAASLVGWLVQENRELRQCRNTLVSELAEAYRRPDEPTLTELQKTMVCRAWDFYPWGLENDQFSEEISMTEDDREDALELLVKWNYLELVDGRGPVGEGSEPDRYRITKKGRRYVEATWPDRGEKRRQKIHRAIRKRANQAAKLKGPVSN